MATITYSAGNGAYAPPTTTFDITTITAERYGNAVYYYAWDTDGTMFVLHTQNTVLPDGTVQQTITGWDQFSGATLLQSATCDLPLQPFLDNLNSTNPSSTKAMGYFLSGDDDLIGSKARDNMASEGGNDRLTGNGGNDVMNAAAGNDSLIGGAGADKLTGGKGADHFVFNSAGEGADKITDFHAGQDHLVISGHGFGFAGPISTGHGFEIGTVATGTGPTLVYNPSTGLLQYDADGAGGAAATALATLTNHAGLTAGDVIIA
jgi:Ca2+-binding RTX toxin-like protein